MASSSSSSSSSYRAVVLPKLSKNFDDGVASLELATLTSKPLGDNDVRVKVMATALNFFDLLITTGQYQTRPPLPHVMCTEASGIITQVGAKVKLWRVGQGVMMGLSAMGSAAEEMVCHERALMPKPYIWSYAEAAAFPVGFITTYHALVHRGQLRAGEILLVTGAAGGMGASCIQLGKKLGATVIACASSPEKLELCRQLGADHVIDYSKENMKDRVNAITKGKWVDVVYDVVGGDVFDQCVRVIAPGGRLLIIGFTSGVIPKFAVNLALVKGFSLVGVRSGAEMQRQPGMVIEMLSKLREWTTIREEKGGTQTIESARSLAPIVVKEHTYTRDNYREAFASVAQRNVRGKAVIVWDEKATVRPLAPKGPVNSATAASSTATRSKL